MYWTAAKVICVLLLNVLGSIWSVASLFVPLEHRWLCLAMACLYYLAAVVMVFQRVHP